MIKNISVKKPNLNILNFNTNKLCKVLHWYAISKNKIKL